MKYGLLFTTMLLCFSMDGISQNPSGAVHFFYLENAPFPDEVRKNGHRYQGTFFSPEKHYQDNSVLVYIPPQFDANEPVNLLVHFHGWYNEVSHAVKGFRLAEQVDLSKKNVLLVLPQGPKNAADSYGGKLENKSVFSAMVIELIDSLLHQNLILNPEVKHIMLSGHSGGYRVIGQILGNGDLSEKIKEVWLYDGLYGQQEKYLAWIKGSNERRLMHIYTNGGGTLDNSIAFVSKLKTAGLPYIQLEESALKAADLKQNRILFIHSKLGHNQVLDANDQYYQMLLASPNLE